MIEIDTVGMYDTAAEEMGKVFISTELGGGTARAATVKIAKRGVLRGGAGGVERVGRRSLPAPSIEIGEVSAGSGSK